MLVSAWGQELVGFLQRDTPAAKAALTFPPSQLVLHGPKASARCPPSAASAWSHWEAPSRKRHLIGGPVNMSPSAQNFSVLGILAVLLGGVLH